MTGRPVPASRHPLAGLLTVMWHYVRDADALPRVGAGAVDPVAFEAQLDEIARRRTVVDWPTVADALAGRRALPSDAALLTWDDGLADHRRTVLPRLAARGWSGIMFAMARRPGDPLAVGHRIHVLLADRTPAQLRADVLAGLGVRDRARFLAAEAREAAAGADPIDVLKRPLQRDLSRAVGPILSRLVEERLGPEPDVAESLHLSRDDLRDLRAEGITIGGHGRRHLWLDWESERIVRAEIRASARFTRSGAAPGVFAYPYGAGSAAATAELSRTGFAAAFHSGPTRPSGRFDLGRVDAETRELPDALDSLDAVDAAPLP